MNINKKVLLAVILAILLLIVIGVFILLRNSNSKVLPDGDATIDTSEFETNTTELEKQNRVYPVILTDTGFTPLSIDIPVGSVISVQNTTEKDYRFEISADGFKGGLNVEKQKTSNSPVFVQAGKYTMSIPEKSNLKLNVNVLVK